GIGSLIGLFGGGSSLGSANVAGANDAGGGLFGGLGAMAPAAGIPGGTASFGAGGGFTASSALTTASLSSSGRVAFGTPSSNKSPIPIFGSGATLGQSIAGFGALGLSMVGGKFGGGVGQAGGIITSLALMAAMNPTGPAGMLLGHLGLMGGAGGTMGTLGGALLGAIGPGLLGFGVGQNFGPVGGTLIGGGLGAGAGALLGLAGAPFTMGVSILIGALAGAVGGLLGGLFGAGKRRKQANAFADTLLPEVKKIEDDYKSFGLDSASAISQLEALRTQAEQQMKALKGEGSSVLNNKIGPTIDAAEKDIKGFQADRDHRSSLTFGAPEFARGGWTGSARGGFAAVLHPDEFVVKAPYAAKNRGALEAMNAGGSAGGFSMGDLHIHTPTFDRKYVRSSEFREDLKAAIGGMRKEGQW
ncbi:MAG: hypothetical protein LAO20_06300, partial [Acidobacteriia bacterium]|nr:hypothetical protein [Terriglobia bacterium]